MRDHHRKVSALDPRWQHHTVGAASVDVTDTCLRFILADANGQKYSNAQIDDYQHLPRRRFPWNPPLRLTVQARFSHPTNQLQGTAGFGFWNDPFMMTTARVPSLPRAVWFFHASPSSNMKLDLETSGCGWKAAAIDAKSPAIVLWAPLAPLLILLMNLQPVYRALWPAIQHSLKIREATMPHNMTQWHTYSLEWGIEHTRFSVGGDDHSPSTCILEAPSPAGPLGFVMWLDNQYLVVTPWGRFRWGLLEAPGQQWMEVAGFSIESE